MRWISRIDPFIINYYFLIKKKIQTWVPPNPQPIVNLLMFIKIIILILKNNDNYKYSGPIADIEDMYHYWPMGFSIFNQVTLLSVTCGFVYFLIFPRGWPFALEKIKIIHQTGHIYNIFGLSIFPVLLLNWFWNNYRIPHLDYWIRVMKSAWYN